MNKLAGFIALASVVVFLAVLMSSVFWKGDPPVYIFGIPRSLLLWIMASVGLAALIASGGLIIKSQLAPEDHEEDTP